MAVLRDGMRIGSYIVERVVPGGVGGFSQVVIARHADGRPGAVALKVALTETRVPAGLNAEEYHDLSQRALTNEVAILRELRHPGLVRLYPIAAGDRHIAFCARAVELPGQPWYFAMEHLEGESVDALIRRESRLDPRLAVELAQQVSATLEYVHGKGYAHLDIKPSNILLRHPSDGALVPQAVLVDFGAAQKAVRRAEVEAGVLVYLSPERVRVMQEAAPPETITDKAAADVYALGVCLYRMLTGRLPFSGREGQVVSAILNDAPTRPSVYRDEIRELVGLDDLIMRMLDKRPELRPKAAEVATELERIMPAPRVAVQETSGPLRKSTTRASRRWRNLALALLALLLLQSGAMAYGVLNLGPYWDDRQQTTSGGSGPAPIASAALAATETAMPETIEEEIVPALATAELATTSPVTPVTVTPGNPRKAAPLASEELTDAHGSTSTHVPTSTPIRASATPTATPTLTPRPSFTPSRTPTESPQKALPTQPPSQGQTVVTVSGLDAERLQCVNLVFRQGGQVVARVPLAGATTATGPESDEVLVEGDASGSCPWSSHTLVGGNPVPVSGGRASVIFTAIPSRAGSGSGGGYPPPEWTPRP
jgi:serine/threonine protein kinase